MSENKKHSTDHSNEPPVQSNEKLNKTREAEKKAAEKKEKQEQATKAKEEAKLRKAQEKADKASAKANKVETASAEGQIKIKAEPLYKLVEGIELEKNSKGQRGEVVKAMSEITGPMTIDDIVSVGTFSTDQPIRAVVAYHVKRLVEAGLAVQEGTRDVEVQARTRKSKDEAQSEAVAS